MTEPAPDADERRARRRKVLLGGAVHVNGHEFDCRVRDVSVDGVRVQIDVPLAPGTPVHVDIGEHGRFPAVVAWVEGEMMGLVFPEGATAAVARFGERAAWLGIVDGDDA